jgi:hypothetical protein
MYLGHYIAWVSASLLFALELQRHGAECQQRAGADGLCRRGLGGIDLRGDCGLDHGEPDDLPGGLAFQSLYPKMARSTGTMIAGAVVHGGRAVSGDCHEVAGFCGDLRNDPGAGGRDHPGGRLFEPEAGADAGLGGGDGQELQRGGDAGLGDPGGGGGLLLFAQGVFASFLNPAGLFADGLCCLWG